MLPWLTCVESVHACAHLRRPLLPAALWVLRCQVVHAQMALWVSGVVLFTLTVNAPLLGPLMTRLGLNKTTPLQRQMNRRVQGLVAQGGGGRQATVLGVKLTSSPAAGVRTLPWHSSPGKRLRICVRMMMKCSREWTGGRCGRHQTS